MSRLFSRRTIPTALLIIGVTLGLSACGNTSTYVLTSSQQRSVMNQANPSSDRPGHDSRVAALKSDGYVPVALIFKGDFFTANAAQSFLFRKCDLTTTTFQQCSKEQPTIDKPSIYTKAQPVDDLSPLSEGDKSTDPSDAEAPYLSGDVLRYVAAVKVGKRQVTLACLPNADFQLNSDSIKKLARVFHAFTDRGVKTGDLLVNFDGSTPKGTPVQREIRWTCRTK